MCRPLLSFIVRVRSLNTVVACVSLCIARAILADRSVMHGAVLTGVTTAVLQSLARGPRTMLTTLEAAVLRKISREMCADSIL